ncbi:MAG: hypothetical protein FWE36_05395 [Erysipelotrichales bacterium]|nr:hypothetical protein [Erysipelotrichales bacterium]
MARVIQKKKKVNINIPVRLIFDIILAVTALIIVGLLVHRYFFTEAEERVQRLFRDCEACQPFLIENIYTRNAMGQVGGPGLEGFLNDSELGEFEENEIIIFIFNSDLSVYTEEIREFITEGWDEIRYRDQYLKALIVRHIIQLNRDVDGNPVTRIVLIDMFGNEAFLGQTVPMTNYLLRRDSLIALQITINDSQRLPEYNQRFEFSGNANFTHQYQNLNSHLYEMAYNNDLLPRAASEIVMPLIKSEEKEAYL